MVKALQLCSCEDCVAHSVLDGLVICASVCTIMHCADLTILMDCPVLTEPGPLSAQQLTDVTPSVVLLICPTHIRLPASPYTKLHCTSLPVPCEELGKSTLRLFLFCNPVLYRRGCQVIQGIVQHERPDSNML